MASNRPNGPTPEELRGVSPEGYLDPAITRIDQTRREYQIDESNSIARPNISLEDVDSAISYYFNEVLQPSVFRNNRRIHVPTHYASPERWADIQKDGALRDANGKFHAPLIVYKRDSITKNVGLSTKIDSNSPANYVVIENRYTRNNFYDGFLALTNRKPKRELYAAIVPEFVTIQYTCVVFADYMEEMNRIVEAITYGQNTYWGDSSKFLFRTRTESIGTTVQVAVGQDRVITATFGITLDGHIYPQTRQSDQHAFKKFYSKSKVVFNVETTGDISQIDQRLLHDASSDSLALLATGSATSFP